MNDSAKISDVKNPTVFTSEAGRRIILAHYRKLLDTFDFEYQERYIATEYGLTYVLESGNPDFPPLLLFHGSSSNSAVWFADIGELAQHFHVFAVDIIGDAGHSDQSRPDPKSDGYSLWIRDLFDGLGIEKASIIGNSLGGWICIKFAAAFPERVEKLVMIASSGITPVRATFTLKMLYYFFLGDRGRESLIRLFFEKDKVPPDIIAFSNMIADHFVPMTGKLPAVTDEKLKKLIMPVLYIAGEDDPTVNTAKSARRLRKTVAHPTVILLKNKGHLIYNVLDKVIPFLQKEKY